MQGRASRVANFCQDGAHSERGALRAIQPPMVKVDGAEHAPIARVGDIELYQWDADLLQPRCWLNDALIAFAFEHMAQGLTEEDGVVLIEPTVAFAAAMVPPDALAEMISGGPAGKARRRPAYCTCIHHGWLEDGARMHHACTRVDHACTTRAIRVGHACTTRGPWLHHVRAPPHAVTPSPPGAAGAAAQGAARRAARERQPGLGALGRRPLELPGLPPAGRHRCAGQGRGQPWSGPSSALVRAGTSHG